MPLTGTSSSGTPGESSTRATAWPVVRTWSTCSGWSPSPTGSFGPDTKRHHPQEMAWVAFVTHEMIETDAPSSISSLTLPLATKGGHRSHAYALDEPAIVSGGRLNGHAGVRGS